MTMHEFNKVLPRVIPEGRIPLIDVEGTAYECGRSYAEIVTQDYPLFREYISSVSRWRTLPDEARRLFAARAPYILELYQGMMDVVEPSRDYPENPEKEECTSFGVSGRVTHWTDSPFPVKPRIHLISEVTCISFSGCV